MIKDTGYTHDYGTCMWYICADMSVSISIVVLNSETFSEDGSTSPHSFWSLRCFQIDRKHPVGQNGSEKEFSGTLRPTYSEKLGTDFVQPSNNCSNSPFLSNPWSHCPLRFSFLFTKSLMVYVYRLIIRDFKDLCPQNILFTSFLDLAFIFCRNKCG